MKMKVVIDGQTYEVDVEDIHQRPIIATIEGERFEVWPETETLPETEAASAPAVFVPDSIQAHSPFEDVQASSVIDISAPLPGVIVAILARSGDKVSRGDELCTLEAMKMKNAIRANRDGTIASVEVSVGDHVGHGQVLMRYEQ